jgi:hypothetical protein
MKTRYLLFSFVLLLALFLAACNPQAEPTEAMSKEKEMVSETTSDTMEEKDDDMMADKDDASGSEVSDHGGDDMMEEKNDDSMKDDNAMMGDKDDDMMSDKDSEMGDQSDDEMMDKDDEAMSEDKGDDISDSDSMMSDQDSQMMPEWFKASLTDVNTGETFTVADFKGKVVLVETLAMWCSNCLKQQGQVKSLHDLVGARDDFVSLGLDIDPNENADALKAYTDNNGFDWVYAVAPAEVSREIGQLYGAQYLNPPSTPMLIIDRGGEVHLLPFGIKSADDLLEALQPFLEAGM